MRIMVGALAAGLGFGSATSLVNILSSPFQELGRPLVGTVVGKACKVLSLLMDAGWSWAALAVVAGWWAGTWLRAASAGTVALTSATVAYYVTDMTVGDAGAGMAVWLVAGLLFGPVLGVVGAAIRRPGLVGLLAALTVPVGAAVQMVAMPPRPHMTITPAIVVAEVIVWTAAALAAGWAVHRFRTARRVTAG